MYQLQRGPMLGDVAGHADEKALLHSRFLAASTSVALLMMAPALYLFSPLTLTFQQVPALDLALQPGQQIPNRIVHTPLPKCSPHFAQTSFKAFNNIMHRTPSKAVLPIHRLPNDARQTCLCCG